MEEAPASFKQTNESTEVLESKEDAHKTTIV